MRHLVGAIAVGALLGWTAAGMTAPTDAAPASASPTETAAPARAGRLRSGTPHGQVVSGGDQIRDEVPNFAREIKPLFERHCYRCHGAQQQRSGYRLDQKEAAFRGGETGERAIVPGDADNSPLVQYIRGDDADFVMPPEGERLTEREVNRVVRWIHGGAPWPE